MPDQSVPFIRNPSTYADFVSNIIQWYKYSPNPKVSFNKLMETYATCIDSTSSLFSKDIPEIDISKQFIEPLAFNVCESMRSYIANNKNVSITFIAECINKHIRNHNINEYLIQKAKKFISDKRVEENYNILNKRFNFKSLISKYSDINNDIHLELLSDYFIMMDLINKIDSYNLHSYDKCCLVLETLYKYKEDRYRVDFRIPDRNTIAACILFYTNLHAALRTDNETKQKYLDRIYDNALSKSIYLNTNLFPDSNEIKTCGVMIPYMNSDNIKQLLSEYASKMEFNEYLLMVTSLALFNLIEDESIYPLISNNIKITYYAKINKNEFYNRIKIFDFFYYLFNIYKKTIEITDSIEKIDQVFKSIWESIPYYLKEERRNNMIVEYAPVIDPNKDRRELGFNEEEMKVLTAFCMLVEQVENLASVDLDKIDNIFKHESEEIIDNVDILNFVTDFAIQHEEMLSPESLSYRLNNAITYNYDSINESSNNVKQCAWSLLKSREYVPIKETHYIPTDHIDNMMPKLEAMCRDLEDLTNKAHIVEEISAYTEDESVLDSIINKIKSIGKDAKEADVKSYGEKIKTSASNLSTMIDKAGDMTDPNDKNTFLKTEVIPRFSNVIKIGFASSAAFLFFGPIAAITTACVGHFLSKNVSRDAKQKMVTELETDLEMIDKKIAEVDGDESKERELRMLKKNMEVQYEKLKENTKNTKGMVIDGKISNTSSSNKKNNYDYDDDD